jgi:HEAT repeat protein
VEQPTRSPDVLAARRRAALAGHAGDEPVARDLLKHPDGVVAATALGALSRMDRLTEADLAAAVADPRPTVRSRAATEAAAHPDLAVPVEALLDDPDATVVEVAAWACGERPAAATTVSRLAGLATGHDDALVREAAVAALGSLGDADGLHAILAATRDKATVRRRAVLALAPFDGPEVDAALEAALGDRDWQVRQAAEDLTGNP